MGETFLRPENPAWRVLDGGLLDPKGLWWPPEILMTVSDVSRCVDISRHAVKCHYHRGSLKGTRFGSRVHFRVSDVVDWLSGV